MGIESPQAKVEDLLATNLPSSREMSSLKASYLSSSKSLIVLVGRNALDSDVWPKSSRQQWDDE